MRLIATTTKLIFGVTGGKQNIQEIEVLAGLKEPQLDAYGAFATSETSDLLSWGSDLEICLGTTEFR
jgi:hypothetical protein